MSAAPTMAFVEIGLGIDLLMPQAKALQLMALMEHAMECRRDFGDSLSINRRETFTPLERPEVRLKTVKPDQIVTTQGGVKPTKKRTAASQQEP